MEDRSGQQSPRLRQLWEELEVSPENGDAIVEKFLEERKAAQGPLVEPPPGNDKSLLLTLLYPGDPATGVRLTEIRGKQPKAAANVEDPALVRQQEIHDAEELRSQD